MGSKLQKKNDYEENQKIMISCIIGIMIGSLYCAEYQWIGLCGG